MASPPPPVLQVTRYDWIAAWLIALVLGLITAVVCLVVVWASYQVSTQSGSAPVELVEVAGGVEDGSVDETLRVEAEGEITPDASPADVVQPEAQIEETLDSVMDLAEQATNLAQKQFELDLQNAGKKGRAVGTGRRALGLGGGEKGIPREQRWFIAYADEAALDEYARQLDFFGIELGALLPEGKLVYISKLAAPQPTMRESTSGGGEKRLYMTWQGGNRKRADVGLFKKAGIDANQAVIFQFYPKETESLLAQLEFDYRKRKVQEIRRTYFSVQRKGAGFEFAVTRQVFFN